MAHTPFCGLPRRDVTIGAASHAHVHAHRARVGARLVEYHVGAAKTAAKKVKTTPSKTSKVKAATKAVAHAKAATNAHTVTHAATKKVVAAHAAKVNATHAKAVHAVAKASHPAATAADKAKAAKAVADAKKAKAALATTRANASARNKILQARVQQAQAAAQQAQQAASGSGSGSGGGDSSGGGGDSSGGGDSGSGGDPSQGYAPQDDGGDDGGDPSMYAGYTNDGSGDGGDDGGDPSMYAGYTNDGSGDGSDTDADPSDDGSGDGSSDDGSGDVASLDTSTADTDDSTDDGAAYDYGDDGSSDDSSSTSDGSMAMVSGAHHRGRVGAMTPANATNYPLMPMWDRGTQVDYLIHGGPVQVPQGPFASGRPTQTPGMFSPRPPMPGYGPWAWADKLKGHPTGWNSRRIVCPRNWDQGTWDDFVAHGGPTRPTPPPPAPGYGPWAWADHLNGKGRGPDSGRTDDHVMAHAVRAAYGSSKLYAMGDLAAQRAQLLAQQAANMANNAANRAHRSALNARHMIRQMRRMADGTMQAVMVPAGIAQPYGVPFQTPANQPMYGYESTDYTHVDPNADVTFDDGTAPEYQPSDVDADVSIDVNGIPYTQSSPAIAAMSYAPPSGFNADPNACPPGWTDLGNGTCADPTGTFGMTYAAAWQYVTSTNSPGMAASSYGPSSYGSVSTDGSTDAYDVSAPIDITVDVDGGGGMSDDLGTSDGGDDVSGLSDDSPDDGSSDDGSSDDGSSDGGSSDDLMDGYSYDQYGDIIDDAAYSA